MLEDSEIEMILERADALTAWAVDVKEYALSEALKAESGMAIRLLRAGQTASIPMKKWLRLL